MDLKIIVIGGCRQAATKNIIKTANIKFNDNNVEATRRFINDESAAAVDNTIFGNSQPSSLWPTNVENYKTNKHNKKIITNKHRRGPILLLLITMTVLMTVIQMPSPTTAATIVQVKDTRHITHHSGGSTESDSHENNEFDNGSVSEESNNIIDIVEMIIKNSGGTDSHNSERTRITKRHSDDFYLVQHIDGSTTDLEWENPCSGVFELPEQANYINPPPSFYLSKLRKALRFEFYNINDTMHSINIDDMATWSKHKERYSFLPNIRLDSNIALKRWYRQMQIYVGAFAYLGRMQYKWDLTERMSISGTTRELNQLLLSARSILCEIETAINGSYPYPKNQRKLTATTRTAMNKKFNFLTNHVEKDEHHDKTIEPKLIDIQFAKSKYYYYLRRMWRVIRINTKRKGQKKQSHELLNTSLSSASISATFEDLNDSRIHPSYSSSSSSSSSESFEYSTENTKRPKMHHKRVPN